MVLSVREETNSGKYLEIKYQFSTHKQKRDSRFLTENKYANIVVLWQKGEEEKIEWYWNKIGAEK